MHHPSEGKVRGHYNNKPKHRKESMFIPIMKQKIAHHIFTELSQTKSKIFWLGYLKKADDFKKSGKFVYNYGKFDMRFYNNLFGKNKPKRWKKEDGSWYTIKGNKPTASKEKHLHLFNLLKKSPRFIAYDRVLWWSINKNITLVERVFDDTMDIAWFEKVPFKMKKALLKAKPNPVHWRQYYNGTTIN